VNSSRHCERSVAIRVLSRDGHGLHMKSPPLVPPGLLRRLAPRNDGKISVAQNESIQNYHTYIKVKSPP